MTEKMGNTEHKEEDSFALYTEKIVPKPSVKYRKRCDASRISGIGKKNGSEEYGQRNSDH